ncbi:acetyl-CoA synthetase-like protein [Amylostereum chailletii]|nr:acetyl-CoA synthetase-like protein [Amylostereum chailletii]
MAHNIRFRPKDSQPFLRPPLDGSLTVSEFFEFHASHNPDYPLYVHADDDLGIRTIKYPEAYRAIRRAGGIASKHYVDGIPEGTYAERERLARPVFGILASADTITYATLLIGINHVGCTAFPLSPRNSPAAVAHLLKVTSVTHAFIGQDPATQALANEAIAMLGVENINIIKLPMPRFDDIYNDTQDFYDVRLRALDKNMISFIFHSSGSTDFPKPISLTSRNFAAWGLLFDDGTDISGLRLAIHALPAFHPMGLAAILWPACVGTVMACFKPTVPPTIPAPDVLLDAALASQCEVLYCVPSFIETWARDPEKMDKVKKFKGVMFGGAPLNKEIGDRLVAAGLQLMVLWGSTEAGGINLIGSAPTKWEWNYFQLGKHFGTKLIPQTGQEGVYELVILTSPTFSPSVINTSVDGIPGWTTGDLIEDHPTRPGFYCIHGRADDQLMLSTGEKTNPVPLEHILRQDDSILSAVMFGRGRFQNGVIVQPKVPFDPADETSLAEFRNKIWPTVLKLNEFAPTHSRLFKETILVTHPDKPLLLTPKGTPQRRACLGAYQTEIESMYDSIEDSSQVDIKIPTTWNVESTLSFIRKNVHSVMKTKVEDEDDLFQHGCDSLQATWIRNTIMHALRVSTKVSIHELPLTFVYSHPSIRALATFLRGVIQGELTSLEPEETVEVEVNAMFKLLDKYSANFTTKSSSPEHPIGTTIGRKEIVVLTGCTGRLGCYLLACLVQDKNVERVYALNRQPGAVSTLQERQRKVFSTWGMDPGLADDKKVVFVVCDFGAADLGLSKDNYDEISEQVTTIIHNAWRVDFNVGLSSFEPFIAGTRSLVDLALRAACPGGAQLLFISSISVLIRHPPLSGAALEVPQEPQKAVGSGYSESKWVAERLLMKARDQTGLRTTVVRVGQLSGDTQLGRWSAKDWIPALVALGKFLGAVPSKPDVLSWVPVDVAATVLVEVMRSSEPVLHLDVVFGTFARRLNVSLIPYNEWIGRLQEVSSEDVPPELISAWSLVHFFATLGDFGSVKLSVERAVQASSTLAAAKHPGEEDVDKYLRFWKESGLPL